MIFPEELHAVIERKCDEGLYTNESCFVKFHRTSLDASGDIFRLVYEEPAIKKIKSFGDLDHIELYALEMHLRERGIFLNEAAFDMDISTLYIQHGDIKAFVTAKRYDDTIFISDLWNIKGPTMIVLVSAFVRAVTTAPIAEYIVLEGHDKEHMARLFEHIGKGEIYSLAEVFGVNDDFSGEEEESLGSILNL